MSEDNEQQTLHLVFGGELEDMHDINFRDLSALEYVGIYPDYPAAQVAWRGKAQETVDNACMRYFIVPLHKLLEPNDDD